MTGEARKTIQKELNDDRIKVISVGPGGEKLVQFASIMSYLSRAAGRCGLGAVMGSKKLKAIAVRGSWRVKISDEEKFRELRKEPRRRLWQAGVRG
jgi:aldehyde:ferredoxin oxidoreductase